MKTALIITLFLAGPALACPPCGPDEEPPTVTPEPETPTPPDRPTESWADRHGTLPASRPLPCCIEAGNLVAKPTLFMSAERALRICEKAKTTGQALIYECPGEVSPTAIK